MHPRAGYPPARRRYKSEAGAKSGAGNKSAAPSSPVRVTIPPAKKRKAPRAAD